MNTTSDSHSHTGGTLATEILTNTNTRLTMISSKQGQFSTGINTTQMVGTTNALIVANQTVPATFSLDALSLTGSS